MKSDLPPGGLLPFHHETAVEPANSNQLVMGALLNDLTVIDHKNLVGMAHGFQPVGLLYRLVSDMMSGTLTTGRIPFYVIGCVAEALFIVVCTRLEYDNTFLVTYVESGVRRVGLAEKLRKIPLSFFGRKDLADLTTSIMNDCAVLEQSQSHFVAPLYGAILSTTVIAVSMLFFNWRMALAAVWPLPVAFAIVLLASDVQKKLSRKATAAKVACEDGIQECMEAMLDLRANNAEERYLSGLEKKIRAVESRLVRSELGTAVFVVSAGLVLRLGIATTALAGAALLVKGELDVLTFFMFLLVVSRLYDPLEGKLEFVLFFSNEYFGIKVDLNGKKKNQPGV